MGWNSDRSYGNTPDVMGYTGCLRGFLRNLLCLFRKYEQSYFMVGFFSLSFFEGSYDDFLGKTDFQGGVSGCDVPEKWVW